MKTCLLIAPGINCLTHRERFTTVYDFPRGALSLGSFLEAKGYHVAIIPLDYYVNPSRTREELEGQISSVIEGAIEEYKPIFIGVSVPYTMLYPISLKILEYCKRSSPDVITGLGGPHPSYRDTQSFEDSPFVDVVIRGEGEWTLLELLQRVKKREDFRDVAGTTVKIAECPPLSPTPIIVNPSRPQGDIKELPPLNYGLLPEGFVRKMAVSIVASRGCPYKCTYCNESRFWGQKVRRFPVEWIVDEIKTLTDRYGNHPVGLEDSMFHMGTSYFGEICNRLAHIELHPGFYLLSRADCINREGCDAMRKAGIRNLVLGIESASPKVLARMNKRVTIEGAEKALRMARGIGLTIGTFWIVGHPGDSPEEAEKTLAAIDRFYREDLHQNSEIALFVPYPGTAIFDHPEEFELEILTYDWERWGRFNTEPVCQLKGFSKEDMLAYWWAASQIAERWKAYKAVVSGQ